MKGLLIGAVLALACPGAAFADQPEGRPSCATMIRKQFAARDYASAREWLLKCWQLDPNPKLLFALGQVELQLGNYRAAIDAYEKFIATGPSEEQIALAQQAIGAARLKLVEPPPDIQPPQTRELRRGPPRRWYVEDTGLVALGGAAMAVGGGLVYYANRLGNDRSGTLADYDDRIDQARASRWTGIGVAAAGGLLIGATLLRWQLRPDRPLITAAVAGDRTTVVASWTW